MHDKDFLNFERMKNITILDFLKTGHLGPVHLGMSLQDVVAQFGPPSEQYQLRNGFLLAYGGWEIHFAQAKPHPAFLIHHDELLYDCHNHDEVLQLENTFFQLDLGIIKPFTTVRLKDMKQWLDREKIAYHIKQEEGQPLMKLNNGVYVDFLDVEPVVPLVGVHACPGKNLELQQNQAKIAQIDDFVLYTIGIFQPPNK